MAKNTKPAAKNAPATATKKAGRKSAPENETKAERFIRLAKPRMTKAIKAISVLGNLSGAGYEYTPEQVDKMRGAIDAEMQKAFAKFQPKQPGEKAKQPGFEF